MLESQIGQLKADKAQTGEEMNAINQVGNFDIIMMTQHDINYLVIFIAANIACTL